MTPIEVAATLRQFNGWRRDFDNKFEQPDPHEIGEAIDAAIEMIERLEAAEKSDAESIAMYRKARDERDALRAALRHEADCVEAAKAEIDALRAKIEAMERQEPSHWGCTVLQSDGRWKEEVSREAPPEGYFSIRDIFPLYALPGAKGEEK